MTARRPPLHATEREMLISFLDYYRAVMIDKASGLSESQLHSRLAPSTLTLGGMLNHLAVVEHWWFSECFKGEDREEPWASAPWDEDPDWELNTANEIPTAELFDRYAMAIERSRAVLATVEDLEDRSARTNDSGEPWSMRWILVHMIEETARHAGHADLIRESLDGETGDFRS